MATKCTHTIITNDVPEVEIEVGDLMVHKFNREVVMIVSGEPIGDKFFSGTALTTYKGVYSRMLKKEDYVPFVGKLILESKGVINDQ